MKPHTNNKTKTTLISQRGIESISTGTTQATAISDFSILETSVDGYRTNGWVRRCIEIISAQASSPPWIVEDENGEVIDNHALAVAFNAPHPQMTRTQFIKTIVRWMELVGVAPVRVFTEGSMIRFGLVNPNRIRASIASTGDLLYDGFEVDLTGSGTFVTSGDYSVDTIIIPRYADPASPAKGVGTLESAAIAVDQDNNQGIWNNSLMANRGRVDDLFTTDQALDKTQGDSLTQRIWEKIRGKARKSLGKPLVLSHGLKYERMGLTPVEVDFILSQKFNREKIFGVFGVPVQLGGSEEASTYNNFTSAMRVLWENKIFDVLNTLRDEFNLFFLKTGMLQEGQRFTYDTSKISALRDDEKAKSETAQVYYQMGVPVSQINDRLSLGFEEYQGWELPFNGLKTTVSVTEQRYFGLKPIQERQIELESLALERLASDLLAPLYTEMLSDQREAILADLDGHRFDKTSFERSLKSVTDSAFFQRATDASFSVAKTFSETVIVRNNNKIETRQEDDFDRVLAGFLRREADILEEFSFINSTTAAAIVEQVKDFNENDKTLGQLRQAIQDVGIFDPIRASRIARTIGTNAASIGQFVAAQETGATDKTWNIAGFATRDIHDKRNGETVPMSARFSAQSGSIGPRWPGDADIAANDRINCRCFLTYHIE